MREFTANEIAQQIIAEHLNQKEAQTGRLEPDPYYLPNFPSEPNVQRGYKVPNDQLLQQLIMQQMVGPISGGKT